MIKLISDVDECEESSPCVNSKRCINRSGTYLCICSEGWSGENCDNGKIYVL